MRLVQCLLTFLLLSITVDASAQATRTWVSGVGDDANPCSRTAPCKTFAGAISKTAAGGEISVLDPGGFGGVTITKSMTIDGSGALAGILFAGSNGVVVNAGATDTVILRNLTLAGANTGVTGVRILKAKSVLLDNLRVNGYQNHGIEVALAQTHSNLNVAINNVTTTGGLTGLKVDIPVLPTPPAAQRIQVSVSNSSFHNSVNGVQVLRGFVDMVDSIISHNTTNGIVSGNDSQVTLNRCMLTQNNTGAVANDSSQLRVISSVISDNLAGFGCGTGTLATSGNNFKAGNTGGGPVCAPNGVVASQ